MTDRYAGFLVTLESDIREDDAEGILTALRMVRGVVSVEPVPTSPVELHIARQRVRLELEQRLLAVLRQDEP